MTDKPNCYKCIHRGDVPGDAHSQCHHPDAAPAQSRMLSVKGHIHGIQSGWFNWPYNFDPTWLLECNGFKAKAVKEIIDPDRGAPVTREPDDG